MKKVLYYFKSLSRLNFSAFFKTVSKISKRSNKSKIRIFFDIIICSFKYSSGYVDYDLFHFEDLTNKQRKTYITRGINIAYVRKLNDPKYFLDFDDKILFNKKFKKFIGREFLDLQECTYEDFEKFVSEHKIVMAKPIDGSGGVGIEKLDFNKNIDIKAKYDELIKNKCYLIEECLVQCEQMNKLGSSSVNTLRLVTVTNDKGVNIMIRVVRMGNGINSVDNFHSGGMYTVFDENGVITKPAIDREGNVYENHPTTGEKIVGFQIPFYKESIELVKEACKVVPQIKYIGFDVALLEDGPVLIEGNHLPGYDLYQSKIHLNEKKEGLKPLFDKVINNQD